MAAGEMSLTLRAMPVYKLALILIASWCLKSFSLERTTKASCLSYDCFISSFSSELFGSTIDGFYGSVIFLNDLT